jgi:hypothetical protein
MSPKLDQNKNDNDENENSDDENQNNSNDENQNKNSDDENENDDSDDSKLTLEEQIAAGVAEALKPLKGNLDKAYAERDAAKAEAAEYERKEKEEHRKRLEEEGKYKELYEEGLVEERAKREAADARTLAAEQRNTVLTRDVEIKTALSTYTFRNEKASEIAHAEVVKTLVKDDSGNWGQAGGGSIQDAVKLFAEHESNSFLLKAKSSSGGGSNNSNSSLNNNDKPDGSLFKMSQADVLKLAEEGKFRK